MKKILYPSEDKIIEFNVLILNLIKIKKSDKPKVLSPLKLIESIDICKEFQGDIFDKAAILMSNLIQKHPFASGNRRTAFITTKYFLKINNKKIRIKDEPTYAKTMMGIREKFYKHEEIKEWIKNGKIKKFER